MSTIVEEGEGSKLGKTWSTQLLNDPPTPLTLLPSFPLFSILWINNPDSQACSAIILLHTMQFTQNYIPFVSNLMFNYLGFIITSLKMFFSLFSGKFSKINWCWFQFVFQQLQAKWSATSKNQPFLLFVHPFKCVFLAH